MVMLVASAIAVLTVMVVLMVMLVTSAITVLTVMVVLMVVLVTSAIAVLIVMVVMMATFGAKLLAFKSFKLICKSTLLLHSHKYLLAAERIPIGGYNFGTRIMLSDKLNGFCKLFLGKAALMAEHYSVCTLDLIIEKLAEILHIHFALLCINYGGGTVESNTLYVKTLNCADNVGKLADARGLDDDALGSILPHNLLESLRKITNERAADAAGVHLGYLYAGLLKKAAVNSYITKLVLNNNELFALEGLCNELFYERGLARTEKAGKNIYLDHNITSFHID